MSSTDDRQSVSLRPAGGSCRLQALAQKDQDLARALLAEGSTPFAEVARRVRVAPSTLYGYFPGGRYGELPPQARAPGKAKAQS